jgi:hypothetical protein
LAEDVTLPGEVLCDGLGDGVGIPVAVGAEEEVAFLQGG